MTAERPTLDDWLDAFAWAFASDLARVADLGHVVMHDPADYLPSGGVDPVTPDDTASGSACVASPRRGTLPP